MKRLDRAEHGMALVWVISLMTLVLMLVGGLLSLAPLAFRQARFDGELAAALVVAESGLNHGLARMDDVITSGGTLADWVSPTGRVLTGGDPDVSGSYTTTITYHPTIGGTFLVEAEGYFNDRRRTVNLMVGEAFPVFQGNLKSTDPSSPYYDPSFFWVEVNVPRWSQGTVSECSPVTIDGIPTLLSVTCQYTDNFTLTNSQKLLIKNSTVRFAGDATFRGDLFMENSEIYVDGSVTFRGDAAMTGSNNGYVQGGITVQAPAKVHGDGMNINNFYLEGGLSFSGNVTIGSWGTTPPFPDVVFLGGTSTDIVFVDPPATIDGSAVKCACGIYTPTRDVKFNGAQFQVYGSIVGAEFEFSGGSQENIDYGIELHDVEIPGALKVGSRNWNEER
jgi:hypothetical protein